MQSSEQMLRFWRHRELTAPESMCFSAGQSEVRDKRFCPLLRGAVSAWHERHGPLHRAHELLMHSIECGMRKIHTENHPGRMMCP